MLAAEVIPATGYQRLHVCNNYFSDRPFVTSENGFEMVQVGWSGTTTDCPIPFLRETPLSALMVRSKRFKWLISDVIFRDNVFRKNKGTLSLRAYSCSCGTQSF